MGFEHSSYFKHSMIIIFHFINHC